MDTSPKILELRNFNVELTKNITYLQNQITAMELRNAETVKNLMKEK